MVVLTAINAKYIHSNLAVYDLKAYTEQKMDRDIQIAEYTINQSLEDILGSLYERKPDIIAFSCYIWNIQYICRLAKELKKVLPEVQIWAGGPEVSFHPETFLKANPCFDLLMLGEGEKTFYRLLRGDAYDKIPGLAYWKNQEVCVEPPTELVDLNEIPFVYKDMEQFEHRIVYYESSRGCPFRCSYCLSSIDKQVRFRDLALVRQELQFFLDQRVPQVKFIDRTFNCNPQHAMAIWQYILEHDNGVTNFHFEISADLLTEDEMTLLKQMRKGLVQFEIGLQTTNSHTVDAIERRMNIDKIKENMEEVRRFGNIHQHLDLIAGLPFEDIQSFRQSFDEAYHMGAEQLQLGFLKVLKGSKMEERAAEYGLRYLEEPPYEVLATNWLSYGDIRVLKRVEEMLEVYHNSGQFTYTLEYLMNFQNSAFDFFLQLGEYYRQMGYEGLQWKRLDRYTILRNFVHDTFSEENGWEESTLDRLLLHDLYLRENLKKRPEWAKEYNDLKKDMARFFRNSGNGGKRMHLEPWQEKTRTGYMLYDYEKKHAFDSCAATQFITEEEFQRDAKGTSNQNCRDSE